MVVPGQVAQEELHTAFVSRVIHIKSGNLMLERSVNILPTVNAEELGWIFGKQLADGEYQDGYTQGEISSDAKLFDHESGTYKELPQYKLNTAVFDWNEQGAALPYNKLLCNAVIAKNKVATGTLELWHVNSGTEIFRHYYKQSETQYGRGAFSRRDTIQGMLANNGVLTGFDNTDWGLMSHMYSRIVQDFIVRGIKHQANGSSGADIFLLENTTAVGSSNTMSEAKRALQDLGYSREQVNKLMFMIKWLAAEGYLDALKHYVRFYNRGTVIGERDRKEFEQQLKDIDMLTVNGRIMSPYSDVLKAVDSFSGRVMAQKSVGNAVVSSGGVLSFSGNAMLVA